ncbi:hypothetical protein IB49_09095 [Geobacillus sp. LC300]|nr:hypothetical protein IB49_09095 [Geobacillus sp. LC300]
MVEYFIEKYGEENVYYVYIGNDRILNSPLKNIYLIPNIKLIKKIFNVVFYSFLLKKKSIQESMLFDRKIQRIVSRIIKENNINIVIYDTIRISQMFEDNPENKKNEFVYFDDLFSVRYSKMLNILEKFPEADINPLGNFKKFVPAVLRPLFKLKMITKLLLNFEKRLIFQREIETAKIFRNNLLISSQEVNILEKRSKQKNIKEVRPFLNISSQFNRMYQGKPEYIFLGSLNIPHNDYSICYFIEENIDILIKTIPNFKLRIIGKHPSDKLINLCKKYKEHIELSGYVESLEQVFSSACAMIVPLQFGSGVKLKTLEAFSRGLPVISTSYGIEGISINRDDTIVDDNILNFPLYMKQLIDLDTNMKYSLKAYNFYQSNYSKRIVYEMYDKVFNNTEEVN